MFSTEDFLARRHLEKQIIDEGTAVWKTKKEMDAARELEDQKQVCFFFVLAVMEHKAHREPHPALHASCFLRGGWVTAGTQ